MSRADPAGVRLSTKRCTRSCVSASRRSSKYHGPATQKNGDAAAAFQATCIQQLQAAIPDEHARPINVWSQDESRCGLLTVRRRRLTARGVQPIGTLQHVFQWFYIYGAVMPTTGDHFFRTLLHLNSTTFQMFLDEFAHAFPDSLNLLVLDSSGGHTAKRLVIPQNVRLIWLPPYSPKLNPIERVWRDLKDALAWQQFTTLEAQQAYVAALLQEYTAAALQSIKAYPYLVKAIHALSP